MANESTDKARDAATSDVAPETPKEDAQAASLHRRLIDGQRTAQAEVAEAFLGPVRRILASRHSDVQRLHPDWIDDAATDALMAYIRHPQIYNPAKRRLLGFLVMAAQRDLYTRLRQEQGPQVSAEDGEGRRVHLVSIDTAPDESIGMQLADENTDVEGQVLTMLADNRFTRWLHEHITEPADWAVVRLLMDGATRTEEYGEAVGLDATSIGPKALARIAYDHKERVKKRVQRLIKAYREGRKVRTYKRRGGRPTHPPS